VNINSSLPNGEAGQTMETVHSKDRRGGESEISSKNQENNGK